MEELGRPLLADPTCSVFYPGKLIFCLPLSFAKCFVLYIVIHSLMSGWFAFFAAKLWRLETVAATFCGISYSMSGYVIGQHCNPIYLVSAAWLPLAIYFVDQVVRRRKRRGVVPLGVCLAMMTLGGDPQMAYHVGLASGLCAFSVAWRTGRFRFRHLASRLPRLATAGLICLGLAAVQLIPSSKWLPQTDRAYFNKPRSLLEALQNDDVATNVREALFEPPVIGMHDEYIYHFSIGPWRWPELIWPNFGGQSFPENRTLA